MSTTEQQRGGRGGPIASLLLLVAMASGCGWSLGRPPVGALSVGMVEGATVEPGLRAALRSELTTSLARRGARSGGDMVRLTILDAAHRPEAVEPGTGRTAVLASGLVVVAEVPSRPGCVVEVAARRSWVLPETAPEGVIEVREEAMSAMARELAERAADALLGMPECREARP